jgi:dienelactone hydrolase
MKTEDIKVRLRDGEMGGYLGARQDSAKCLPYPGRQGRNQCNGKVGAVGYCLGGKLCYLMCCRTDIDCRSERVTGTAAIAKPAGDDP